MATKKHSKAPTPLGQSPTAANAETPARTIGELRPVDRLQLISEVSIEQAALAQKLRDLGEQSERDRRRSGMGGEPASNFYARRCLAARCELLAEAVWVLSHNDDEETAIDSVMAAIAGTTSMMDVATAQGRA